MKPTIHRTGAIWLASICSASIAAAFQSLGLVGGGSPSITSPAPIPLFIVATVLGTPGLLLFAGLLPLLWCLPLLQGNARTPVRSVWLTLLIGAGSLLWFLTARLQHLNSDGSAYTLLTAVASLTLFVATLLLLLRGRVKPSMSTTALGHLILFVWLCSYAFTWFGEVP